VRNNGVRGIMGGIMGSDTKRNNGVRHQIRGIMGWNNGVWNNGVRHQILESNSAHPTRPSSHFCLERLVNTA
jgi:hypothetical protein